MMSGLELTADTPVAGRRAERHMPGEEGVWVFILGDMTVFALFFAVFAWYRGVDPALFTASQQTLNAGYGLFNTCLLLTSSWFVVLAMNAARRHLNNQAALLLVLAFLCGLGFSLVKFLEYGEKIAAGLVPTTNNFYMFYYILTGLHFVHVVIGMVVVLFMAHRARRGIRGGDMGFLEGGASYWHMVDLLWIVLFPLIYLMK
ncbi:MAG: cytochrome c oxidase subunit 3 [Pseudomonadota bacterium]|jgi:nitric oxide reductase NorE protein|nr:cytochrome c oxidase subunit 3 [Pseudomonadota bacterium]